MALEAPEKRKARIAAELAAEEVKKGDLERLVQHVKENPVLYAAGTAFILVCLLAGGMFGLYSRQQEINIRTEYARALEADTPATSASELQALADEAGTLQPEVLYMLGTKALEAETYGPAEDAFTKIVDEYPHSQYAAGAADALGFILENRGKFEEALAAYQRVYEHPEWRETLIGKREAYKIGRVQEALGRYKEAAESYQAQIDLFGESEPWAIVARAQAALDKLKEEHPGLFPEEATTETAPAPELSTSDAITVAPAPAVATEETVAPATGEAPATP